MAHLFFDYGDLESYLAWKRLADRTDVEWKPVAWPRSAVDGKAAAKGHILAAMDGQEASWMRRVFEAQWVQGRGITKNGVLEAIASQLGVADFARRMADPETERLLESNALEAGLHRIARVPCLLADGRAVVGAGELARYLKSEA